MKPRSVVNGFFLGLVLAGIVASPRPAAAAEGAAPGLGTEDVVLPAGYVIEPVATGFTYPTSIAFAPDGSLFVAEAGYSYGQYWTEARIFRLRPGDRRVFSVASGFRAPVMGLTFHEGRLYVAHRGMVSVVDPSEKDRSRRVRDLITGLPVVPNGQHFNGPVAFGPDGKMYFAVGAVTNSGVPGADDVIYGWLADFPWMRDAPARALTLTGSNYPSPDLIGADPLKPVSGGAFLPFGTPSRTGQVVAAHPMPTGAVYRANPDGSGLEVFASGIRSPAGFAFGPDGRLYMTNHGADDKGARPAGNVPDTLLEVRQGAWYGWPDFLAGVPVTDERYKPVFPLARRPDLVLRDPPPATPPLVRFEPHAADMKFDWSRSDRFGFAGEMFLAEFGDGAPITSGLRTIPHAGFRIVRVNPAAGTFEPFLTIRNPGSEATRGPKRPMQALFDPSGENLYLLDFGVLAVRLAGNRVGIDCPIRTGTVWRIRRAEGSGAANGAEPPAVAHAEGGRRQSWWMARAPVLEIRKYLRAAVAHAARGRTAPFELQRTLHREQGQELLDGAHTAAVLAMKRIDDPDVLDDGTRFLLGRVAEWAAVAEPATLMPDDSMIAEIDRWLARTAFPETDHLFRNYALPGRWQRPVEKDVRP